MVSSLLSRRNSAAANPSAIGLFALGAAYTNLPHTLCHAAIWLANRVRGWKFGTDLKKKGNEQFATGQGSQKRWGMTAGSSQGYKQPERLWLPSEKPHALARRKAGTICGSKRVPACQTSSLVAYSKVVALRKSECVGGLAGVRRLRLADGVRVGVASDSVAKPPRVNSGL
ncbi:uncharacterized protein EV422DRAFT_335785 [Fimicolochytrium jonesii]|uniref:uncharacterized protein n=1 Tax=Fimicolochytrium jonesii TaxID=1396493 RepID=UPI0022FE3BB1|nr:uncharacterized protein EV422DRAFT_335785 [Fimicolochytrium jonesii]KAI8815915.1 hypothetical protein EV422DRAFT_335785 [Fimicolochytrium jonesii]